MSSEVALLVIRTARTERAFKEVKTVYKVKNAVRLRNLGVCPKTKNTQNVCEHVFCKNGNDTTRYKLLQATRHKTT